MSNETQRSFQETKRMPRKKFLRTLSIGVIGVAGIGTFLKRYTRVFDSYSVPPQLAELVNVAFRLTDHRSLLNLEFYFINCHFNGSKITARYGPHENYMIVRLPQQHIAEQTYEGGMQTAIAGVHIAGYSYLVFRILFPVDPWINTDNISQSRLLTKEDGIFTDIDVTAEGLMDWANDRKFRLVVRQDLVESIFELKESDTSTTSKSPDGLQNHYPFQTLDSSSVNWSDSNYKKSPDLFKDNLRINRIPKVYGDPITAVELPWRLIISPKLPDSGRFKFRWRIPSIETSTPGNYKLWTAALSITERDDEEYLLRKIAAAKKNEEDKQASTASLDDVLNQLELMIIGSPDYRHPNPRYEDILPRSTHRDKLVALYIKLKILATTEQLTFSAIGASTIIHLKNNRIEDALKNGLNLIEWNQVISLGRDEKVEVSSLFLEAEFGHKMAYIEVAERQLSKGYYPLIRKAFIMPLDVTKDYANHISQEVTPAKVTGAGSIISKFNSPFKKITFLETKPKLFEPLNGIAFTSSDLIPTATTFEFEAVDWQDNVTRFTKKINALPFEYALSASNPVSIVPDTLEAKSDGPAVAPVPVMADSSSILFKNAKDLDSVQNNKVKINELDNQLGYLRKNVDSFGYQLDTLYFKETGPVPLATEAEEFGQRLKNYYEEFFQFAKNAWATSLARELEGSKKITIDKDTLRDFIIRKYVLISNDVKTRLKNMYSGIAGKLKIVSVLEATELNRIYGQQKITFEKFLNTIVVPEEVITLNNNLAGNPAWIQNQFTDWSFSLQLYDLFVAGSKDQNSVSYLFCLQVNIELPQVGKAMEDVYQLYKEIAGNALNIFDKMHRRIELMHSIDEQAKKIQGLILLQKKNIGFAVREEVLAAGKKSLSALQTEYIIFKGGLRETENKVFDFFHEYAIIPQVEQAKVYVSALNKLVNEELPISINYAREYIENQVRDTVFEAKQNAAMVFANVQEFSRQQVKGLVQKLADKMPGINVEIPVHYLTYATNPRELADEAIDNVKSEFNDLSSDLKKQLADQNKDLVFISEEVKNSVKVLDDLKNSDPKKYFRNLGAKLFGSIALEDILDIGFDIPRLTELPDKIIYQVSTQKFKDFRAAFVLFKPHVNGTTRLDLFISKSTRTLNEYYAYTQLNNFSVGIVIGGADVLVINFEKFKISSSNKQAKKTDVTIKDVKLGGPLEFIADLAKKFMAPGNGMRIKPGPRNLMVDYTITLPDIVAPAFNFKNLQLVIGVNIPYDPSSLKAISFILGVNKPEDKFVVSAGIYGGRGHFMLRGTPKGIDQIDIAIELGAYSSISLGSIGKGEVFLFFGFWFVTGKDDEGQNMVKAVAYVICAGSATVLGWITIGVSVLIALTYIKRGNNALFYGEAVVSYSVKIAFFKKEFSVRYYKEIAGSSGNQPPPSASNSAEGISALIASAQPMSNEETKRGFADVYKDEAAFQEYLSCFAN